MTDNTSPLPEARVEPSGLLSWVWLIPLAAAAIAGWLAWSTYSQRGDLVQLTFETGEGLAAGTTRVRHRSVELGTVENVRLTENMRRVVADVRMRREAEPYLTDRARFWVVRPRLGIGNLSGLETIVSGAFIEMDPGRERGVRQTRFDGLTDAPAVRSDEPGQSFQLRADRIGSISVGSPVFYRDVTVGEVLEASLTQDGRGPASIVAFVRAPHDRLVRAESRFWNASGVDLRIGAEGVRVEVESLRAVLAGAIAFDTPAAAPGPAEPPVPAAGFTLHPSRAVAEASTLRQRIPALAYFETTVRGLAVGAPVELLGVQVGTVTAVGLAPDGRQGARPRVRIGLELQPDRIALPDGETARPEIPVREMSARMVALGVRAQLRSANLLTGQMLVALDPVAGALPAELGYEGEVMVLPSAGGGSVEDILASVASIARKLDALPMDRLFGEVEEAVRAASGALGQAQTVLRSTEAGLPPVLRELRETLARAGRTLASVERGYGADSVLRQDGVRTLEQVSDAARSIRLLADFLARNPESLLRGRAGSAAAR